MGGSPKTVPELLAEFLDLEVRVTKKSDGKTVREGEWYWAGIIAAVATFPLFLVFRWLFGK